MWGPAQGLQDGDTRGPGFTKPPAWHRSIHRLRQYKLRMIWQGTGQCHALSLQQPCHLFLPRLCEAVLWLQLAQGTGCMGQNVCCSRGDMAHTMCWAGHHGAHLWAKQAGASLTSPAPCIALGVQPSKAAAMARNCKAGTGPPQSSQLLIGSRHPVLTPHLHLIYPLEPAGP